MRGIACVTLSSEELLLFPTLRPMFHKPFLVHNGTDMPQLITSTYIYIYTYTHQRLAHQLYPAIVVTPMTSRD